MKMEERFKQKHSRAFRGIKSIESGEQQTDHASIVRKFTDVSTVSVSNEKKSLKPGATFVWCCVERDRFIGRLDVVGGQERLLLPGRVSREDGLAMIMFSGAESIKARLKYLGKSERLGLDVYEYQIERVQEPV